MADFHGDVAGLSACLAVAIAKRNQPLQFHRVGQLVGQMHRALAMVHDEEPAEYDTLPVGLDALVVGKEMLDRCNHVPEVGFRGIVHQSSAQGCHICPLPAIECEQYPVNQHAVLGHGVGDNGAARIPVHVAEPGCDVDEEYVRDPRLRHRYQSPHRRDQTAIRNRQDLLRLGPLHQLRRGPPQRGVHVEFVD